MTKRGRGLVGMAGTPPCAVNCPERNEWCHAKCDAYAAYAAWRKEVYEEREKMFRRPKPYAYEIRIKRAKDKIRRRERGL